MHGSSSKLSSLQRRILAEGLKAHWDAPLHRAWDRPDAGSFGIDGILEDYFRLEPELICRRYPRYPWARAENRKARAQLSAPRAATSRAIARLVTRGLMEKSGRAQWRLTSHGVQIARELFPNEQAPACAWVRKRIKEIFTERKTARGPLASPLPKQVSLSEFCASCMGSLKKTKTKPRGINVSFVGLD